eukprot:TRINITY_DN3583_c0_g2_i1.p1 TRINITY_DN3583_c0_g2~~TRINITY_DN3583_c0_g2_i1.p1  ORF type:complete len:673 (-),score=100.68 TRINITY_DN3583_c0_g2_i1:30-2048(-)
MNRTTTPLPQTYFREHPPTRARVAVPVHTVTPCPISKEVATYVQRELNAFASVVEQQKAQLLAALQMECSARMKDVSQLLALRERDLAERQQLQCALDSLRSSAVSAPAVAQTTPGRDPHLSACLNSTAPVFRSSETLEAEGCSQGLMPEAPETPARVLSPVTSDMKRAVASSEMNNNHLPDLKKGITLEEQDTLTTSKSSDAWKKFDLTQPETADSAQLSRQATGLLQHSTASSTVSHGADAEEALNFMLYCNCTRMGYHVRLVGSAEVLGSWQPQKGLILQTSALDFPLWRLRDPVKICSDDIVEYKYVICDQNGAPSEWENRSNRTLKLGGQALIKDVYNSYENYDSHFSHLPSSRCSLQVCESMTREESYSFIHARDPPSSQQLRFAEDFRGCYELLGSGPLGEGAFGQVWRCCSKAGESAECAAKIVRTGQLKEHELRRILGEDGEIAIHRNLRHEHIVQLHEHFEEAHTVTLVLEYCCGGDLFDAIVDRNGLSESATTRMLRHLLLALSYLHRHSVMHRDVKCENILLQHGNLALEDNTFKLCDLGLAARVTSQGLQECVGSPDTVAPEVLCGMTYGSKVDIWSSGVVTYMALVASSPFAGASTPETLRLVKAANYSMTGQAWSNVSNSAKAMVSKLMNSAPAERPCAETALADNWLNQSQSRSNK